MTDRAALLNTLLADPSRAIQVRPDEAVALLTELSALQVVLLRAACSPTPVFRDAECPNEDRLLNVDEAAAMIGVTPRWLYRNAATLPFTRRISPRIVRFSRAGIQRWLAARRNLNDPRS